MGIGTTNPSEATLVVNGAVKIDNYILPLQDKGVDGYILKTDGKSNVDWLPDDSAAGLPSGRCCCANPARLGSQRMQYL